MKLSWLSGVLILHAHNCFCRQTDNYHGDSYKPDAYHHGYERKDHGYKSTTPHEYGGPHSDHGYAHNHYDGHKDYSHVDSQSHSGYSHKQHGYEHKDHGHNDGYKSTSSHEYIKPHSYDENAHKHSGRRPAIVHVDSISHSGYGDKYYSVPHSYNEQKISGHGSYKTHDGYASDTYKQSQSYGGYSNADNQDSHNGHQYKSLSSSHPYNVHSGKSYEVKNDHYNSYNEHEYKSPQSYSGSSGKTYAVKNNHDSYNGNDYKSYTTPHSYSGHSGKTYDDSSYPKPHGYHVDSDPHSYQDNKYESYKTHDSYPHGTPRQSQSLGKIITKIKVGASLISKLAGGTAELPDATESDDMTNAIQDNTDVLEEVNSVDDDDRTAQSFFGHSLHGPHFYGGYPRHGPHFYNGFSHHGPQFYRGFSHHGPRSYRGYSHYGPQSYGGYYHRIGHSFKESDGTAHNYTGTDEGHNPTESRSEHQQSLGKIITKIKVGASLISKLVGGTAELPDATESDDMPNAFQGNTHVAQINTQINVNDVGNTEVNTQINENDVGNMDILEETDSVDDRLIIGL